MQKQFAPYFKEHFYDKMRQPNDNNPVRDRAPSMLKVFELLDEKADQAFESKRGKFSILETGTMRPDHGSLCFGDDGCSTYIFDKFMEMMGGRFASVDINQVNTDYARFMVSDLTDLICSDSVKYLYSIPADRKFDLIYLDSFDIYKDNPHPSQLHHLKELCAVLKNAEPGTIIMIDDHDAFFTMKDGVNHIGKGNYVKSFMEDIGAKLIYEGYQIVFQL